MAPPPKPTIDEIVVADPPEAWASAGFTVDDDDICRIGQVRIHLVGRERGKRIVEWSMRDIGPMADGNPDGDIDGLTTFLSTREPCAPAAHANGALLIDHVVLITPDQQRTIGALSAVGYEARRTRETDTYGAPFLQTFFRAGEVILELIGPAEPSGDGPASFFGLAYTVDDLDATKALLGDGLGNVKDAVQPGRQIATLRHKEFGVSVATAFMSPGRDSLQVLDADDG